jgi:hypothetical protein
MIATSIVAWRQAIAGPLVPLTLMIAGGLMYASIVTLFPAARGWFGDAVSANRTLLAIAPLCCAWLVLAFRAWSVVWFEHRGGAVPA